MKEPQFPKGRIFLCNTQDEWLIYREFLSDEKGHELRFCLIFVSWSKTILKAKTCVGNKDDRCCKL